jgi:enoyl-CoA hydratase
VFFEIEQRPAARVVRLTSADGMNRLSRECVLALTHAITELARTPTPLVITGNDRFFSTGADLQEISALDCPQAYEFSKMGQALMAEVENFPAPVCAAVSGYCMGGGLDLALAHRYRVAQPHAIFGHRGAALGLITGWGGTQRLPRLVGKAPALEIFITAEKIYAQQALRMGLIDGICNDPVADAIRRVAD